MSDPNSTFRTDETAAPGATNAAGDGVQISGARAAQGRTGSRAFVILIASLVLVVLALFGMFALHAPGLAKGGTSGGQSGASAPAATVFNTPQVGPKQSPPNTPSTEPGSVKQPGVNQ